MLIKRYVELGLNLQVIAVTLTVVVVDGLYFALGVNPVQGADIDTVDEYAGPVNNQNSSSNKISRARYAC